MTGFGVGLVTRFDGNQKVRTVLTLRTYFSNKNGLFGQAGGITMIRVINRFFRPAAEKQVGPP